MFAHVRFKEAQASTGAFLPVFLIQRYHIHCGHIQYEAVSEKSII